MIGLSLAFLACLAAAAARRGRLMLCGGAALLAMATVFLGSTTSALAPAALGLAAMAAGGLCVATSVSEARMPPVALTMLLLGATLLTVLEVQPVNRISGPEVVLLHQLSFALLGAAAILAALVVSARMRAIGAAVGLALASTALLTIREGRLLFERPLVVADGAPLLLLTWREAATPPLLQAQVPHPDPVVAWIFVLTPVLLLLAIGLPHQFRRAVLSISGMGAMILVALPLFSGEISLAPDLAEQLLRPGPGAANAVLHPVGSTAVPALAPVLSMAVAIGLATALAVRVPSSGNVPGNQAWSIHLALVLYLVATGVRIVLRLQDGSGPIEDPVAIVLLAGLVVAGTSALTGERGRQVAAVVMVATLVLLVSVSGSWW